jgi:hypothetical protein
VSPPVCVYCGAIAECKDHLVGSVRGTKKKWAKDVGARLVPSCSLCNSIIRDYPSPYIWARSRVCLYHYERWLCNHSGWNRPISRDETKARVAYIKQKVPLGEITEGVATLQQSLDAYRHP